MLQHLPSDMLFVMTEYLSLHDYKKLYQSTNQFIQSSLKQKSIICSSVVDDDNDELLQWFNENEIKVELLRQHIITPNYGEETYLNGKYHSFDDKPSHVIHEKMIAWHKNGDLHRENGPAMIIPVYLYRSRNVGDYKSLFWYENGIHMKTAYELPSGEITSNIINYLYALYYRGMFEDID